MPNVVKYTTDALPSNCLKKGNFAIGNNNSDYGLTFYNGITPPSGGYTIYLNKESGGPSIYCPANDAQLIIVTNQIAGTNYTNAAQCINYFASQTDKLLVNQDYPTNYPYIVMDGIVLNLDASINQSYPGTGTAWADINGLGLKNNGTLLNGPTFSSNNGGSIEFDNTNDYFQVSDKSIDLEMQPTIPYSCFVMFNTSLSSNNRGVLISNMDVNNSYSGWDCYLDFSSNIAGMHLISSWSSNAIKIQINLPSSTYNNKWMYFGYTYNGSSPTTINNSINSVSFYINGELYNGTKINETADGFDTTSTNITYSSNQRCRLASRFSSIGKDYGISGNVGLVHVYKNKMLSAQEVLQNFNAVKNRFNL